MSFSKSNLRKQIRKLPKMLRFVKSIQHYSILFIRVLRCDPTSRWSAASVHALIPAPREPVGSEQLFARKPGLPVPHMTAEISPESLIHHTRVPVPRDWINVVYTCAEVSCGARNQTLPNRSGHLKEIRNTEFD